MPVDNSDYLDPDGFSSLLDLDDERRPVPLTMHLTASEITRLSITLTKDAQQCEFAARNREAKARAAGVDRAPGVLTIRLRERADETRSLVNAFREAAGMPFMTADDLLEW